MLLRVREGQLNAFHPFLSFLNTNKQCHDQMVLCVRRDLLAVSIVLWGSEVSLSKKKTPACLTARPDVVVPPLRS